jgi:lipopolysaccharide transport system permease protein
LRNIQSGSMISPNSRQSSAVSTTFLRSAPSSWTLGWADLSRHRELLYFLTWRDIKVRYKQTVLGIAWAILQPLAVALALAAFLGRVVHVTSGDLPYPVFAYTGMVLWQLFAQGLTESSNSIVNNERLVSKVYFPRLLLPLSAVLASLLDFAISLLVMVLFLVYYRISPTASVALLPLFVLPVLLASLGSGILLAALNVKFRDVRYTVNFLVQLWFFATPVAYPTSVVPMRWRRLYELNPIVGALDGFRWALSGQGTFPVRSFILAIFTGTVLLIVGLYYFRRTEDTFADNI